MPAMAKDAVWPAIKDILESMSEVMDTLKEGAFPKITPRAVFALSPGYARYPEQMRENVRKFDVKRSTDSWNKIRDLRHTLI